MPAARGVKRAASKASASTAAGGPKNKKKRNVIQLEIPHLPRRRGAVFTCGQGDVGQLGHGEDVMELTKFKNVTGLGDKIVDVCAGGMHTMALDTDGKVWTFGCNDEGALGRSSEDEGAAARVLLPARAVRLAAGDSHSAALLANGDVYAWGSFRDSHGSMGLVIRGREGKACREPIKIDIDEPAVGIASGGDHLVILTTSGSVYTMGCGEQGQLGRLSQRSASRDARHGFSALLQPGKVSVRGGARRVWAGAHASFAEDSARRILAWGLNNYGQLGITGETRKTAIFSPTECDAFQAVDLSEEESWSCVSAGQHHTIALDSRGRVYALGRVEYGRLGLGARPGDATSLEPIPKLQNARCVSVAATTSSSFAVTDSGEIFSWGMGSEGQLGTGDTEDASEPEPAKVVAAGPLRPARVAAGGQHTVLLMEDPSSPPAPPPAPHAAPATRTVDTPAEEPVEKKPKGRPTKGRQRKQEQEEEVSSTSSAHPDVPQETPQKVNGDDQKDTAMEVDETDAKESTDAEKEKSETDKKDTDPKENTNSTDITEETTDKTEPEKPDSEKPVNSEPNSSDPKENSEEKDTIETGKTDIVKSETGKTTEVKEPVKTGEANDVEMKDEVNGNGGTSEVA